MQQESGLNQKLASIHYKLAQAVLKLKCKPSSVGTLGELGWLPIKDHLDKKRVSYFQHLKSMDENRITKVIFNSLLDIHNSGKSTPFDYFSQMKQLFISRGLDHMYHASNSTSNFKRSVQNSFRENITETLLTKSSL